MRRSTCSRSDEIVPQRLCCKQQKLFRLIEIFVTNNSFGQATVILRDAGFPQVANLHGGMLLWQQMGLPVLRSTSPLP